MDKSLLSLLVCPVCKGRLIYVSRSNELLCELDQLAFPVKNKLFVLLLADARKVTVDNKINDETR